MIVCQGQCARNCTMYIPKGSPMRETQPPNLSTAMWGSAQQSCNGRAREEGEGVGEFCWLWGGRQFECTLWSLCECVNCGFSCATNYLKPVMPLVCLGCTISL